MTNRARDKRQEEIIELFRRHKFPRELLLFASDVKVRLWSSPSYHLAPVNPLDGIFVLTDQRMCLDAEGDRSSWEWRVSLADVWSARPGLRGNLRIYVTHRKVVALKLKLIDQPQREVDRVINLINELKSGAYSPRAQVDYSSIARERRELTSKLTLLRGEFRSGNISQRDFEKRKAALEARIRDLGPGA